MVLMPYAPTGATLARLAQAMQPPIHRLWFKPLKAKNGLSGARWKWLTLPSAAAHSLVAVPEQLGLMTS